jgi:hypothetical protein
MQWFYFVRSNKRVALWAQHYGSAGDADDAFYDSVRLFYPTPAILYDRGYPIYSYYACLAKTESDQQPEPSPRSRSHSGLW